ncbi:hypothetical protein LO749_01685 [Paracoccus denitrificans]|uniref:hypothetical protein n=1 Tax=Paracoccus denitrificans TaxID=266 RepID=UPI001E3C6BA1|nr:hypothetical protein [Paracoccus denitrificans]UFS65307.1 hypothetical protein LO749_01685 [Paracoccus denitrificans]
MPSDKQQAPERIWADQDNLTWVEAHPGEQRKDCEIEYLRRDLCASGQQVRALEWDEYSPGCFFGRTEFGNYAIAPSASAYHAGEIRISGLDGGFTYAADIESAKAAAQADYERRILAALTPAPQPAGEVELICVACEDNPKHPNIPCAVCGAHPPQPSETGLTVEQVQKAWTAERDRLIEENNRLEMQCFTQGKLISDLQIEIAALRALSGGDHG